MTARRPCADLRLAPAPAGPVDRCRGRHLDPAIARSLARGRAARKLSQRAAAVVVGVTAQHLAYLERGLRRPSTVVAWRLLEVYELDAGERAALIEAAVDNVGYARAGRSIRCQSRRAW